MLGWLNDCMEKLVLSQHDAETWLKIKRAAHCRVRDGGFLRFNSYPDKLTRDLMVAAAEELGISTNAFLQRFGAFFAGYIVDDQGFGNLLKGQGKTLKDLLANANDMHAHIQSTSPKLMTLPQFWVDDSPARDGSLVLHYRSKRGHFLAPLVEGMVTELATKHFHVKIDLERTETQGEDGGADFTSWNLRATNPKEQWKLTVEPDKCTQHQQSKGGSNIVNKCPFTGMTVAHPRRSISSQAGSLARGGGASSSAASLAARDVFISDDSTNTNNLKGNAYTMDTDDDDASEISSMADDDEEDYKIGLSGDVTEKLFPYHVMVNKDFLIGQVGKDLPGLLHISEFDLIGQKLGDILTLKRPTGMDWNWKCINLLQDQSFEVEPVHPPPPEITQQTSPLCFKTTMVHVSQSPSLVMLVLTPHTQTFQELSDMNLTISDLPLHGGYRDSVFLSEHLSSQMNNSLKVEKLTRHLHREKDLLEQLLPTHAAEGLRKGKIIQPMLHQRVTFFFSDIVGFTSICDKLYPWQVIEMLNNLYCVMDFLALKFNLFKIETIGDAYVCCSGLPHADLDHARNVANFAVAVSHCVRQVLSPADNQTPIQLRIGVHTGQSASGVVGVTNPRYCVFGDTVNVTARHESSGMAGRVHCSSVTRQQLEENYKGSFTLEERGLVEMKGKGKRTTYWLSGSKDNPAINKAALAKLDEEVKDLLVKADFKIETSTATMEAALTAASQDNGKTKENAAAAAQAPKPKREFRLPSKTSVIRCSAPSMHDVRRIGSLMRRIKNGNGPAKNFSWTKKKRLAPRKTKSMGDYEPPKRRRSNKMSDASASAIAERLAPLTKKPRLGDDTQAENGGKLTGRSPNHSPLSFQYKMETPHRLGGGVGREASRTSLSSYMSSKSRAPTIRREASESSLSLASIKAAARVHFAKRQDRLQLSGSSLGGLSASLKDEKSSKLVRLNAIKRARGISANDKDLAS